MSVPKRTRVQGTSIIVGGDNRYLNYTTLVDGLSTVREFDFVQGAITFSQNLSSPRWCALVQAREFTHDGHRLPDT